jgi:hypothetical protein
VCKHFVADEKFAAEYVELRFIDKTASVDQLVVFLANVSKFELVLFLHKGIFKAC